MLHVGYMMQVGLNHACAFLIQEYTNPSKTMRQEELSGDEQPPPVLPEGQYHIEKLLAQRKKVYTQTVYIYIYIFTV